MLRKINFYLSVLILSLVSTDLMAANAEPLVIPAVRQWSAGSGTFSADGVNVIVDKAYKKILGGVAEVFSADLNAGKVKSSSKAGKGDIFLTLDTAGENIADEGYVIEIGSSVVVRAKTSVGVYWATRTLLQMIAQDAKLPKGKIVDYPDYPIRSVLLDVGRKFIPFDELKDWVVALSYFKMNEVHLHLNDNCWNEHGTFRLEMKTIPGLASKDGHYTQDQIRELQDFAKVRGVTITPEIDSPGHARAFTMVRPDLAHPKLGGNYLDITREDTYRFMEKVFDEVIPLFDAPHFHIGTDEYRLGRIGDKAEREMLGEKFRQYINHFNKYIRNKGKTVRIWSGYEHMPGTTEPDKSVVIDMWETSDAKNKSKAGYKMINSTHLWTYIVPGAPYYGVSNTFLYNEWTALKFSNKPSGQLTKDDPGLLGGKLHIWNDFGVTGYTTNEIARLSMPTVMVMGEKLWGVKGSADYKAFAKRAEQILGSSDGVFEMIPGSRAKHSSSNPMLGNVPGTTFLTRQGASKTGVVWQLKDGPLHLIPNTMIELDTPGRAENLEYPWTATFTLTRLTDVPGKWGKAGSGGEILLGSDLATIYLDYLHVTKDKKTKEITEKRGVTIVRANQAPGPRPIDAYNADIVVFDYQVPRGKKVTLTLVGQMKSTELYVDGKLIGSSNKQMVCPIKRIGDAYPNGMHGILHDAIITDSAIEEKVVAQWQPKDMSQDWKTIQWDVTDAVDVTGAYAVKFQYTAGGHRLDISKVELLQNDKVVTVDEHQGITGGSSKDNTYTLPLENAKDSAVYKLRATIRSDGGTDSNGEITIIKTN